MIHSMVIVAVVFFKNKLEPVDSMLPDLSHFHGLLAVKGGQLFSMPQRCFKDYSIPSKRSKQKLESMKLVCASFYCFSSTSDEVVEDASVLIGEGSEPLYLREFWVYSFHNSASDSLRFDSCQEICFCAVNRTTRFSSVMVLNEIYN